LIERISLLPFMVTVSKPSPATYIASDKLHEKLVLLLIGRDAARRTKRAPRPGDRGFDAALGVAHITDAKAATVDWTESA